MKTVSVFSYFGSENLGDAIQTIALEQLLRKMGVSVTYRDRDSGSGAEDTDIHVANGYLDGRWKPMRAAKTIFAGVHVRNMKVMERVAAVATGAIGCRDPYTCALARSAGLDAEMIGCATLTFDPYAGPSEHAVNVDAGGQLRQRIPKDLNWQAQLWRARERLAFIRQAELVITSRLHIALPCLAFGTPVVVPESVIQTVHEPERLSLLDALGFKYGEPQVIDVEPLASRYCRFVERVLE